MKKLIVLIAVINLMLFPQTDKRDLLEEIKSRDNIKVTEEGNDIYQLEYPYGRKLNFNFGKTEICQLDSIPTTVIETWNVDTTLYKDMYYFWQEVPVATISNYELVIGDANRNGYPEIYGHVKDYEDPGFWMPTHIFELDTSGLFQDRFAYPDSHSLAYQLYDIDLDGNEELYMYMLDGRHIFYKKDNPQSLPTTPDFIFSLYSDQIDHPNFGDFDKNGVIDFLFKHHVPRKIVVCEYNQENNNFDSVFEIAYGTGDFGGYAVGDFDMDEKTDFVYGGIDGEVYVIETESEHNYSLVWESNVEGSHAYWQIFTNDIDGNGKPEFWVASTTYYGYTDVTRYTCFEYTDDNEYEEKHRIDFVGVFPLYAMNGFATDVDKDGKEELVLCIADYVFILKCKGSTEPPVYKIFYMTKNSIPGGFFGVTMYDLDGDVYAELLIHRGTVRNDGKTKEVTHIFKPDFVVSVRDENGSEVLGYSLEQNYPNPFNQATTVSYYLPEKSYISLKVFDILGNEVTVLDERERAKGKHIIQWDGKDKFQREVNSGVYFIHLSTSLYKKTIKGVMLK